MKQLISLLRICQGRPIRRRKNGIIPITNNVSTVAAVPSHPKASPSNGAQIKIAVIPRKSTSANTSTPSSDLGDRIKGGFSGNDCKSQFQPQLAGLNDCSKDFHIETLTKVAE